MRYALYRSVLSGFRCCSSSSEDQRPPRPTGSQQPEGGRDLGNSYVGNLDHLTWDRHSCFQSPTYMATSPDDWSDDEWLTISDYHDNASFAQMHTGKLNGEHEHENAWLNAVYFYFHKHYRQFLTRKLWWQVGRWIGSHAAKLQATHSSPSNCNSTDYWQFSLGSIGLRQMLRLPEF